MTAFIFHEIRNPLNAMLGAIQMIACTVKTTKEKRWAQIAINTMGMVSNVLNDVLFLSKIEEGKVTLNKHSFSMTGMIEEMSFMFSEQAEQKRLALIYTSSPERMNLHVVGDEGRLKEVMLGLSETFWAVIGAQVAVIHARLSSMRWSSSSEYVSYLSGVVKEVGNINTFSTQKKEGVYSACAKHRILDRRA